MSLHSGLWFRGRCPARERAGTQGSRAAASSQERCAMEEFKDSPGGGKRARGSSFSAAVSGKG